MTARAATAVLPRLSIALTALAFAAFGALTLVRPELLGDVGLEIVRPVGAVEVRGFYGGFELGMAAFFALAYRRPSWHPAALTAQALALGGTALGRAVGLALGGGAEPLILLLMAAEAAGCALGVAALRAVRAE